jgi:hypothetical protein
LGVVPQEDREDGRADGGGGKSEGLAELGDASSEVRAATFAVWGGDYMEGGQCGGGNGGRGSGGEEKGPGGVEEVVTEDGIAGDEGAAGPEGFSEGPDEDVWLDAEVGAKAGAAGSEGSHGVGFVDEEDRVVVGGDGGELGQGSEVAVHAEKGFRDEQSAPGPGSEVSEMVPGSVGVEVWVDGELGPRQPESVYQAGVDGSICDDQVGGTDQCGDGPKVGVVAARKDEGSLGMDQSGESVFESEVGGKGAGDQAGCTGTEAESRGCLGRRALEGRMGGEPEVVVGGEGGQGDATDRDPHTGPSVQTRGRSETVVSVEGAELGGELIGEGVEHGSNLQGAGRAVNGLDGCVPRGTFSAGGFT